MPTDKQKDTRDGERLGVFILQQGQDFPFACNVMEEREKNFCLLIGHTRRW